METRTTSPRRCSAGGRDWRCASRGARAHGWLPGGRLRDPSARRSCRSRLQDRLPPLRRRWPRLALSDVVERDVRWVSPAQAARSLPLRKRHGEALMWRMYRNHVSASAAWRDRHALSRNGIELRTPFPRPPRGRAHGGRAFLAEARPRSRSRAAAQRRRAAAPRHDLRPLRHHSLRLVGDAWPRTGARADRGGCGTCRAGAGRHG